MRSYVKGMCAVAGGSNVKGGGLCGSPKLAVEFELVCRDLAEECASEEFVSAVTAEDQEWLIGLVDNLATMVATETARLLAVKSVSARGLKVAACWPAYRHARETRRMPLLPVEACVGDETCSAALTVLGHMLLVESGNTVRLRQRVREVLQGEVSLADALRTGNAKVVYVAAGVLAASTTMGLKYPRGVADALVEAMFTCAGECMAACLSAVPPLLVWTSQFRKQTNPAGEALKPFRSRIVDVTLLVVRKAGLPAVGVYACDVIRTVIDSDYSHLLYVNSWLELVDKLLAMAMEVEAVHPLREAAFDMLESMCDNFDLWRGYRPALRLGAKLITSTPPQALWEHRQRHALYSAIRVVYALCGVEHRWTHVIVGSAMVAWLAAAVVEVAKDAASDAAMWTHGKLFVALLRCARWCTVGMLSTQGLEAALPAIQEACGGRLLHPKDFQGQDLLGLVREEFALAWREAARLQKMTVETLRDEDPLYVLSLHMLDVYGKRCERRRIHKAILCP